MSRMDDVRSRINNILKVRDDIGATLESVSIVTRTWSGAEIGLGTKTDVEVPVTPGPRIVKFNGDEKVLDAGIIKIGDLMLKQISRQTFPNESDVDGISPAKNIEKFYVVGGVKYQVLSVQKRQVTWTVIVRRRTNQG